jgi:hypothetical protein
VLQLEKLFPKPKVNPGPHIATSAIRDPGKIAASVKHNPSIRPHESSAPVKPQASKIPNMAFGKVAWEKYFGDIGIEPPLPPDIEQILNAPCPFWPGKKVQDTHLLTLVPKTVNEKPLTLIYLEELVKTSKQGNATQYSQFDGNVKKGLGSASVPSSYWVLMTRDVIERSLHKYYSDQCQLVETVAKNTAIPYVIPKALEATLSILMHYVRTKQDLYIRAFTRCQEKVYIDEDNQWTVDIQGPASNGLSIFVDDDVSLQDMPIVPGIGALRSFGHWV